MEIFKKITSIAFLFELLFCFLTGHPSYADPIPELMASLDQELSTLEAAIATSGETAEVTGEDEDWYARNFWIRIQPRVVFTIPAFVEIDLIPEMQMLVQRPFPGGWASYMPN